MPYLFYRVSGIWGQLQQFKGSVHSACWAVLPRPHLTEDLGRARQKRAAERSRHWSPLSHPRCPGSCSQGISRNSLAPLPQAQNQTLETQAQTKLVTNLN